MLKRKAIICDIDGTIADIEHRMKWWLKKPRDYAKFYEKIEDDAPISEMIALVNDLAHGPRELAVIYLTGRHEGVRARTQKWLNDHGLPIGPLFMRDDVDFRSDTDFKKTIYYGIIAPKYDVQFVLEDRSRVVAMWRSIRVKCLSVAEGNY